MDVGSLEPGVDVAKAIQEGMASCDVLVAVIGRRWLTAAEGPRRRLDNPQDSVRLEIGTALKCGIRVIPVLAEGALMPQPGQLPEDLRPLTQRNALNVNHERFRADADRVDRRRGGGVREHPGGTAGQGEGGAAPRGRSAPAGTPPTRSGRRYGLQSPCRRLDCP